MSYSDLTTSLFNRKGEKKKDYSKEIADALVSALNYESYKAPEAFDYKDFDYNVETDKAYNSIKNALYAQSDLASKDTLGQYATMTGGMPSTAAVSAATQAGAKVRLQVPQIAEQFKNNAYSKYRTEREDAYAKWQNKNAEDYNRWKDGLSRAYNDLTLLQDAQDRESAKESGYYDTLLKAYDAQVGEDKNGNKTIGFEQWMNTVNPDPFEEKAKGWIVDNSITDFNSAYKFLSSMQNGEANSFSEDEATALIGILYDSGYIGEDEAARLIRDFIGIGAAEIIVG